MKRRALFLLTITLGVSHGVFSQKYLDGIYSYRPDNSIIKEYLFEAINGSFPDSIGVNDSVINGVKYTVLTFYDCQIDFSVFELKKKGLRCSFLLTSELKGMQIDSKYIYLIPAKTKFIAVQSRRYKVIRIK